MPAKRGSQPNDQLDELRKRLRTAEQALKQRESELQREKERRDELGSVVQKARKVFECPVCLNLCLPHRAPVLLAPCAHLFCRDCVEVVANAVAPANASCPMCSALFRAADIKDLKTSNIALHRQLLGLHIDCPLECDWTGDVGDLDTHFESCGMAKCEASGCDAVIKLPDTVPQHMETCPKVIVSCSNAGCTRRVCREAMSLHQNVCGHKIVVCPEAGCNHKCKRAELDDHLKTSAAVHLGLLKTLVPQPSKSISDPVEERCLTFRKFTIEIPDTLRAPSAEERNNPDWRSYMPSTFFFVAGVKFELVGFISNSDRIEIGPTLDDFRFQSVRIGFRFRLIEKNGRFSGHTGLNLVEISDRYCSVDMFHSGSCALLEDGSKWTRIDEEGKRSFSLELKIYLHSASPVVKGGPVVENVNRRLLHTLPYDVDGEDWSVAAALF